MCVLPGVTGVTRTVRMQGLSGITIHGCGPASVLWDLRDEADRSESMIKIQGCTGIRLEGLSLVSDGLPAVVELADWAPSSARPLRCSTVSLQRLTVIHRGIEELAGESLAPSLTTGAVADRWRHEDQPLFGVGAFLGDRPPGGTSVEDTRALDPPSLWDFSPGKPATYGVGILARDGVYDLSIADNLLAAPIGVAVMPAGVPSSWSSPGFPALDPGGLAEHATRALRMRDNTVFAGRVGAVVSLVVDAEIRGLEVRGLMQSRVDALAAALRGSLVPAAMGRTARILRGDVTDSDEPVTRCVGLAVLAAERLDISQLDVDGAAALAAFYLTDSSVTNWSSRGDLGIVLNVCSGVRVADGVHMATTTAAAIAGVAMFNMVDDVDVRECEIRSEGFGVLVAYTPTAEVVPRILARAFDVDAYAESTAPSVTLQDLWLYHPAANPLHAWFSSPLPEYYLLQRTITRLRVAGCRIESNVAGIAVDPMFTGWDTRLEDNVIIARSGVGIAVLPQLFATYVNTSSGPQFSALGHPVTIARNRVHASGPGVVVRTSRAAVYDNVVEVEQPLGSHELPAQILGALGVAEVPSTLASDIGNNEDPEVGHQARRTYLELLRTGLAALTGADPQDQLAVRQALTQAVGATPDTHGLASLLDWLGLALLGPEFLAEFHAPRIDAMEPIGMWAAATPAVWGELRCRTRGNTIRMSGDATAWLLGIVVVGRRGPRPGAGQSRGHPRPRRLRRGGNQLDGATREPELDGRSRDHQQPSHCGRAPRIRTARMGRRPSASATADRGERLQQCRPHPSGPSPER